MHGAALHPKDGLLPEFPAQREAVLPAGDDAESRLGMGKVGAASGDGEVEDRRWPRDEKRRATAPVDSSRYLFPSPRRKPGTDAPARSLRESLHLARAAAKMPHVGFHHLRHYFASHAVMSGIDVMTVAAWLGHRDGGILVGKVYGHLCDEHRRRMSEKLRFA